MSDLKINGKDALREYGIRMGEGFLNEIFSPYPLKEFIENKSRMTHGKRVIHHAPKMDERDVTLTFNLEGETAADYLAKYQRFRNELAKGLLIIEVLGSTFRLTYNKSVTFAMDPDRTFAKISCKFNEAYPSESV